MDNQAQFEQHHQRRLDIWLRSLFLLHSALCRGSQWINKRLTWQSFRKICGQNELHSSVVPSGRYVRIPKKNPEIKWRGCFVEACDTRLERSVVNHLLLCSPPSEEHQTMGVSKVQHKSQSLWLLFCSVCGRVSALMQPGWLHAHSCCVESSQFSQMLPYI